MQVGNLMILGSMGPRQPVYGRNLNAQPFYTAELQGFTNYSFEVLANPLDPCIDCAISTLGDLGVTANIFQLCQCPFATLRWLGKWPTWLKKGSTTRGSSSTSI